jgi:preprotein translocase subunit YajC
MLKKSLLFLLPAAGLFAQESAPANPGGGMTQTLIMIGIALVFFYFILWRPEQKRRKASEQMRSALKKGDRVTAMGIVGKIDRIQDQTVILKMVDGAKIEMLKAAITDVQPASDEDSRKEATIES